MCAFCKHRQDRTNGEIQPGLPQPRCAAFPFGIPTEIWHDFFDHREVFPGDRGIRFETASSIGTEYVSRLYDKKAR